MKKPKKEKKAAAEAGEVVKFDEAGMPQLDVWLEDETVWLTQAQMATLFGCATANINMHLNHIYADKELEKRMTAAERSIDTIIYTLMPALPANRKPIGFNP